jgi:general secretion pathway protein H
MQRQRGLTLLELLVVLAIIGLAMAGVSLSLRDNAQTQLEREAQRLIAVLEASRAQSRTSGVAVRWQATPEGFVIQSPLATRTEPWLTPGTQATVNNAPSASRGNAPAALVLLGPEPIIAPVRISLSVSEAPLARSASTLSIGTDGLQPFHVLP